MATHMAEGVSETAAPQRGRMLWMIGLIVVLIIAVGAGVWFLMSDEGTSTATFDGEVATYDGPTTLEAGSVTFTFDASEYEPGVAFVIGEINDDSITFADLEAYSEVEGSGSARPDFLSGTQIAYAVEGDLIVEKDIELSAGMRYAVFANTSPSDTDRAHPAAVLEVE